MLLTYPLDLARARLATLRGEQPGQPRGLLELLRLTAREGWAAPFRGLGATLVSGKGVLHFHAPPSPLLPATRRSPRLRKQVGIVPYAGINFFAYGGLKEAYRKHFGGGSRQPGVVAKASSLTCALFSCVISRCIRVHSRALPG